ncbi:MAG: Rdx family protein [Proteobacteria bacterium]|nr:Rdx family protein [Pseudomonadota bacterium]
MKARDLIASRRPDAEVSLRKTGGGVFEITVDGRLRYSKKAIGRFPSDEDVLGTLA